MESNKLVGKFVAAEINRGRCDIRREEEDEQVTEDVRRERELRSLVIPFMIFVFVAKLTKLGFRRENSQNERRNRSFVRRGNWRSERVSLCTAPAWPLIYYLPLIAVTVTVSYLNRIKPNQNFCNFLLKLRTNFLTPQYKEQY